MALDFALTDEQLMLRDMVRDFVERELPKEERQRLDDAREFPQRLWDALAGSGLMGLAVPEEYGGDGASTQEQAIVLEELSYGMLGLGSLFLGTSCFGSRTLVHAGTEEQRAAILPQIVTGGVRIAMSLTESTGGTDPLSRMSTFAEAEGDSFRIRGRKMFTSGASVADYLVVVARTKKDPERRSDGVSMFLVDARSPGISLSPLEKLGSGIWPLYEVFYDDVLVPASSLLGELHRGFRSLVKTLNNERISVAAMCIGLARRAFDIAVDYARERTAFGRPIGQYQAIQHALADVGTGIDMARLATQRAAWLEGQGLDCGREAVMAKLVASEVVQQSTQVGMRVLAGHGYVRGMEMDRLYRESPLYLFGPISNEMARNFIAESYGLPRSY